MIKKLIIGNSRTVGGSLKDALNYPATVSYKGATVKNTPIRIHVETIYVGQHMYAVHLAIADNVKAFARACQKEAKRRNISVQTTETLINPNGNLLDVYVPLADFRAICGVASSLNIREYSKTRAFIGGCNPNITDPVTRSTALKDEYRIDLSVPTICKVPTGYVRMDLVINGKKSERITIKIDKDDVREIYKLTEGFCY